MRSNTNDNKQQTLKFLRGELNKEEEKELLGWISKNAENSEQFKADQYFLNSNLSYSASAETYSQWKNLSQRIGIIHNSSLKLKVLRRMAYVAGIAAAFVIGLYFASLKPIVQQSETIEEIAQTFSTPNGARTHFNLPDGTTVWLNAGTHLTFAKFGIKERIVELNGEAYFKVKRDESRPFIIATQFGKIKVLGTSFNVKAYGDDQFSTTVEEGLVNVSTEKANSEVFIKPGEQAILSAENSVLKVNSVETQIYTSWKDGVLIFKKDALADIVKKLERWYNVDIELAPNMELKNYRFTGNIEMESLPEVLELIRITAPIKYSYDAKKRIVKLEMKETT